MCDIIYTKKILVAWLDLCVQYNAVNTQLLWERIGLTGKLKFRSLYKCLIFLVLSSAQWGVCVYKWRRETSALKTLIICTFYPALFKLENFCNHKQYLDHYFAKRIRSVHM